MLLSATSEALARLRVSDLTAAAPCGPSLFEHTGFCKQGGPVLDTSRRDGYREAGEWQQAGGDQRDRPAQKVFARAGSRKPRSDQHQECSTTDNHGYRRLACRRPIEMSSPCQREMTLTVGSSAGRWRHICGTSSCRRLWRWRSVSAARAMSFTTATRAPGVHRWRSAAAAAKPACAHPWDLSVTPDFVATLIFLWAQR